MGIIDVPYIGFELGDNSFINSPQVVDYLRSHDYLKVLTFSAEESDFDEQLIEVELPTSTEEYVFMFDSRVRSVESLKLDRDIEELFYVNHQDDAYVRPTEEYLDLLFLMYQEKRRLGEELFPTLEDDECEDFYRQIFGSRLDS